MTNKSVNLVVVICPSQRERDRKRWREKRDEIKKKKLFLFSNSFA